MNGAPTSRFDFFVAARFIAPAMVALMFAHQHAAQKALCQLQLVASPASVQVSTSSLSNTP